MGSSGDAGDECAFTVRGVELVAAEWRDGKLVDGGAMRSTLPDMRFVWREQRSDEQTESGKVLLPLYLNETRRSLLLRVPLPADAAVPEARWFASGTALLASRFD